LRIFDQSQTLKAVMNQTQHLSQRKFTSLIGVSRETYQILWRLLHDCNAQWQNSF